MLGFCARLRQRTREADRRRRVAADADQPGSGKDYQAGWLNLDIVERTQPDLLLNLAEPLELPLREHRDAGELLLEEGSVELINANNVLEHVPDLVTLMATAWKLLAPGGEFRIEVPPRTCAFGLAGPDHVRAFNENNSWSYYTDWFWYLGWYEHRFEIADSSYLDERVQPCEQGQAAFAPDAAQDRDHAGRAHARPRPCSPRLPEDDVRPLSSGSPRACRRAAMAQGFDKLSPNGIRVPERDSLTQCEAA